MRAAIIFDNLGPYHQARLRTAARIGELTVIQVSARSAEYAWDHTGRQEGFTLVTLLSSGPSREAESDVLRRRMNWALDTNRPDVVFVPGWSSRASLAALDWCARHRVPSVMMSDSTAWDHPRVEWKERIKSRILSLCSAGLVAGQAHVDYLVQLGMPPERIATGYDVVDNDYFLRESDKARGDAVRLRKQHGLPENYFLASARFVEKKNLPRLLEAYALYRSAGQETASAVPWSLVLLGDGPLRPTIEAEIARLGLRHHVLLPGFIQYPDLPIYYALASALIHASTTEQWGLVINEAMACSLPVVVSDRCGCASDLIQEGTNGFTFNPYRADELASLMTRVSKSGFPLAELGSASRRIIANWGPERFANGMEQAAEFARNAGPPAYGLSSRLLPPLLYLLHPISA